MLTQFRSTVGCCFVACLPAAAAPVYVDVDNSALEGLVSRLEIAMNAQADAATAAATVPPEPAPQPAVRPCSGNGMRYELEETGLTDLHCECFTGFKGVNCEAEDLETPLIGESQLPTPLRAEKLHL